MVDVLPRKQCRRCGHRWIPRLADVRVCPHCQSPRFDAPFDDGRVWRPTAKHLKRCARCRARQRGVVKK